MTEKHTPGPWYIKANVIYGDMQRNGSVAVASTLDVAYPYGRRAGESARANACLIAAAPELLEALKLARAIVGHPDDTHTQLIDAVIAKATGAAQEDKS